MRTLHYKEEIKEPPVYPRSEINPEELKVAKQLNISMVKIFDDARFHNEYQMRIKEKVEDKIAAQDIIVANEETPQMPYVKAIRKSILESNNADSKPKGKKGKTDSKTIADPQPHE